MKRSRHRSVRGVAGQKRRSAGGAGSVHIALRFQLRITSFECVRAHPENRVVVFRQYAVLLVDNDLQRVGREHGQIVIVVAGLGGARRWRVDKLEHAAEDVIATLV